MRNADGIQKSELQDTQALANANTRAWRESLVVHLCSHGLSLISPEQTLAVLQPRTRAVTPAHQQSVFSELQSTCPFENVHTEWVTVYGYSHHSVTARPWDEGLAGCSEHGPGRRSEGTTDLMEPSTLKFCHLLAKTQLSSLPWQRKCHLPMAVEGSRLDLPCEASRLPGGFPPRQSDRWLLKNSGLGLDAQHLNCAPKDQASCSHPPPPPTLPSGM